MKKMFKIILLVLIILGLLALSTLYVTTHDIPVLQPKGMIAMKERTLLITASLLMLIVVIPVFIMMLYFVWKYREDHPNAKYSPNWAHSNLAECFWWGVPLIIIVILAVITWKSSHDLSPFKPIESEKKPLTIQVVALNWKWLFIYPEQGIATINYVQFPEKVPIRFEITADAPMNSFWIPQLGGQIYAMPAMRTELYLIANETGKFRGASSNISGKGFAGMYFTAEATTEGDFDHWVQTVHDSPKHLTMHEYSHLVVPSEYVPVMLFGGVQGNLFDRIIMKYQAPQQP